MKGVFFLLIFCCLRKNSNNFSFSAIVTLIRGSESQLHGEAVMDKEETVT